MEMNELIAALVLASEYLRDVPRPEPEVTGFRSALHATCFDYGVADDRMGAVEKLSWALVFFANSVRVAEHNDKPILPLKHERTKPHTRGGTDDRDVATTRGTGGWCSFANWYVLPKGLSCLRKRLIRSIYPGNGVGSGSRCCCATVTPASSADTTAGGAVKLGLTILNQGRRTLISLLRSAIYEHYAFCAMDSRTGKRARA
jgi:hypothetical protein